MDLFSGNIAGGAIGAASAKNIQESQQAWLEQMSNTAYQRQVADMKAAGINPMLAATQGGGASTPSSPTAANAAPGIASSAIGNAVRYANIDKPTANANIGNTKENTLNLRYDSGKKVAEAGEAVARTRMHNAKTVETLQSAKKLAEDTRVSRAKGTIGDKVTAGTNAAQELVNKAVKGLMGGDKPPKPSFELGDAWHGKQVEARSSAKGGGKSTGKSGKW